jgi:hypothetical protein
MSNELHVNRFSALTVFACRFDSDGLVFLTDGSASEIWGTGARDASDYAVAMTEVGSSGHYVGDFDASGNIIAGIYPVAFYEQAGVSPADTDIPAVRDGEMDWDGTDGEVFRSTIHDFQEADIEIDTATTPWTMKIKKRDTSTVLLTKQIRDVDGVDVTQITSVIGSLKDS